MIPHQPKSTNHSTSRRGMGTLPILIVLLLLIIPGSALFRASARIDWRILAAVPVSASAFAFFAYRSDKRRAELEKWRVPESTLHPAELCGGWPGAFLAQRKFRHKTAKASFQIIFWGIVLIHQLAAIDYLLDWRFAKYVGRHIETSHVRR